MRVIAKKTGAPSNGKCYWTDPQKGAWCTERGAYWFEGLVRLAWELDDPDLKAYAKYGERTLKSWPALRYGHAPDAESLLMTPRPHTNEWDWRWQHGVLCYESMLSFVKATQWTGDGKYLENALGWLDIHARQTRQPHGVTVADE